MGYLLDQKGGYANVGFCKKDLYNYIDEVKRGKIKDGDAMAALSYLQGKADNEPVFFSKFLCSDDGKLTHLFWADGISRADYQFFGDVVAFDATYKKNKYRYQLVIFSDETIQTYKWVLEMFLKCMFNKHPSAVVTDGDGAMREASRQSFEQEVPSQNDNNISASNQVSRGVSSRKEKVSLGGNSKTKVKNEIATSQRSVNSSVKKHNPSSSTQNVTLSAPDIGHNLQPHNQFIGSFYMGHVHIREGMSIVIPFQPSFGVQLRNSHAPPNVAGVSGWNDLLQQVMRNSGGTGGYPGQN
ncbi:FAR1-related protein [Sesbania bispinosa]|nr:FAR1-related protein [Sesbania bispinosa]